MPLVALPQPYDFDVSTERFRAFGPDLANLWHEGGLHRVVGGREVRIEAAPGGVLVGPLDPRIEAEVRTLLGAPFDLAAFSAWAGAAEPVVRRLAGLLQGFRPPLAPDPFEALVGSITAQQVSLFAAFAIRNRLIERFGERADHAYAFPTRARIAQADEDEVVAVGFSRRKAEYLIGLARSDLDLAGLADLPDDEVRVRLTALRGLGEWTADWFLARHLARPRAWPAGDLGLRKAVRAFYGDVDVRTIAERFDPFQNLTAHYLLTGQRVLGRRMAGA
jgi:3-methyladenine DNA glycosylase/8-oxoguanine DNA glycosylase